MFVPRGPSSLSLPLVLQEQVMTSLSHMPGTILSCSQGHICFTLHKTEMHVPRSTAGKGQSQGAGPGRGSGVPVPPREEVQHHAWALRPTSYCGRTQEVLGDPA